MTERAQDGVDFVPGGAHALDMFAAAVGILVGPPLDEQVNQKGRPGHQLAAGEPGRECQEVFARVRALDFGGHGREAADMHDAIDGQRHRADDDDDILDEVGHDHAAKPAADRVDHGDGHGKGQDVPLIPRSPGRSSLWSAPGRPSPGQAVDDVTEVDALEDAQGIADVSAIPVFDQLGVGHHPGPATNGKKKVVATAAMASDHISQVPMMPYLATSLQMASG